MSYFAAAFSRSSGEWSAEEVDLDEFADLEGLAEHLRELAGEGAGEGPVLLLIEEDDEYVAVVRADGGPGSLQEPRVFLSDRRAVQGSQVAAMLWETVPSGSSDDDEGTRAVAEPVGDAAVVADLGTPAAQLLELCAEEGLLPADVITTLCEHAGCLDALDSVREA